MVKVQVIWASLTNSDRDDSILFVFPLREYSFL